MAQGTVTTKKWKMPKSYFGYFFIAPAIIYLIVIAIYPLINTITMSFQSLKAGQWIFVGFDNYIKLFNDAYFGKAFSNTLFFTTMVTLGHLTVGMFFAILLNENWFIPVRNFMRGLLILPWLFSSAAGCLMWSLLYHPLGFLNSINKLIAPSNLPIDFLGNPTIAMYSIITVVVWIWFPFYMVSILGGLQSIPTDLYEAAKVDGAGTLQRFWYITLPQLKPVLIAVSTIDLISTVGHVDAVKMLTQGGPMRATENVAYYVWKVGINDGYLGYGAAISTLLLIGMSIFTFVYLKVISRGGDTGETSF